MAFFKRVFDHIFNQVLVDSLANSRWFQRFAVWSHSAMKDLQAKSKDGASLMDGQFSKFAESAKAAGEKFRKDFAEEMSKVQMEMEKQAASKSAGTDPSKLKKT
mmetsp:Transcript_57940/g.126660  ORF Transcript_57940/g.126660 Transcript_57940/m.126660 type:complete len:104 (-) Transcript_57940:60-371(-)